MESNSTFPNVFAWISNLPLLSQWKTTSMSLTLCSSSPSSNHLLSLELSLAKSLHSHSISSFSIVVDFNPPISLWTSKPLKLSSKSIKLFSEETILNLLHNFVEDVLCYGPSKSHTCLKYLKLDLDYDFGSNNSDSNSINIFNYAFLTLSFLICIYEAPNEPRSEWLHIIRFQLEKSESRQALKLLMKLLGFNLEEQWMRSTNLAITNWIVELQARGQLEKRPSTMFSYSFSTLGLWQLHLYCPVIAMDIDKSSNQSADEKLRFSLNYHQLEGVIQFNYKAEVQEEWVDVMVDIDNIRCDITRLVSDTTFLSDRGLGAGEKHFPSRISLQLTPTLQTNILSVSVSKSSENPTREIGLEKSIGASFDPPNPLSLQVSAGESVTLSLKPWKFEQSVYGYSANLNWFLHDSVHGNEVISTKPSKFSLLNPKAWFRNRYSSAHRPFTRQGGVVFAGDEYGESVWWKIDKSAIGKTVEWEIRGSIWLTYWPNKYRTFYTETRRLEFRELFHLTIA